MNALVALVISVGVIFLIGNVVETRARREPKSPKSQPVEDLRVAYAPDLIQVGVAERQYMIRKVNEQLAKQAQIKRGHEQARLGFNEEERNRFQRELEEAKIKRLLEGNPVTDENPLTKKERPSKARYIGYYL